jgi:hypothetical protein
VSADGESFWFFDAGWVRDDNWSAIERCTPSGWKSGVLSQLAREAGLVMTRLLDDADTEEAVNRLRARLAHLATADADELWLAIIALHEDVGAAGVPRGASPFPAPVRGFLAGLARPPASILIDLQVVRDARDASCVSGWNRVVGAGYVQLVGFLKRMLGAASYAKLIGFFDNAAELQDAIAAWGDVTKEEEALLREWVLTDVIAALEKHVVLCCSRLLKLLELFPQPQPVPEFGLKCESPATARARPAARVTERPASKLPGASHLQRKPDSRVQVKSEPEARRGRKPETKSKTVAQPQRNPRVHVPVPRPAERVRKPDAKPVVAGKRGAKARAVDPPPGGARLSRRRSAAPRIRRAVKVKGKS